MTTLEGIIAIVLTVLVGVFGVGTTGIAMARTEERRLARMKEEEPNG